MNAISAVAFDLDGLMFNSEDLYDIVIGNVLEKRGHDFPRTLKHQLMGLPTPRAIMMMRESLGLDDSPQTLADEIEGGMEAVIEHQLQPMPGLLELLDFLEEQRIPKAIATGSSRRFLDNVMRISRLGDRFEFTLTSDDVTRGKPDPEIYLTAAERFGISAENMLALEDSDKGSRAAVAAGALTVVIPGEHGKHLTFDHVQHIYSSLAESDFLEFVGQRLPAK